MDVVDLTSVDRAALADMLDAGATHVAVDPIDGGLKVKVGGRWTPAFGRMSERVHYVDAPDDAGEDLRAEVDEARRRGELDVEPPDPSEYRDLGGGL